jgi:hypothetical protein
VADQLPLTPLSSNHSTKTEDETGLASEVETMKIVSLGLEDHGLRSYAALKSARGTFQNKHGVSLAVIMGQSLRIHPASESTIVRC